MRRGELLALRWEHIQPDGIRVRDALVSGKIKTPKSDRARTVPFSPEMRDLLDELRTTRWDREGHWSDPTYVFTNANGKRWDEKNFGRSWRRLRKRCVDNDGKALVRPLSFHCCRHTFASWSLEAGKSVVWLQHALGHASPDTTLRRYPHWVRSEVEDMSFLRLVEPAGSSVHRGTAGANRGTEISKRRN